MKRYVVRYYNRSNVGGGLCASEIDPSDLPLVVDEEGKKELIEKVSELEGWRYDEEKDILYNDHFYEGASYGYEEISFIEVDNSDYEELIETIADYIRKYKRIAIVPDDSADTEPLLYLLKGKLGEEDCYVEDDDIYIRVEEGWEEEIADSIVQAFVEHYLGDDLSELWDIPVIFDRGGSVSTGMNPYENQKEGWSYKVNDDGSITLYTFWYQGSWEFVSRVKIVGVEKRKY